MKSKLYPLVLIAIFSFALAHCTKSNAVIGEGEPNSDLTISEAIQGMWTGCQVYDREKNLSERECEQIGQIEIRNGLYNFYANPDIKGPSSQGTLDFLFDEPTGKVNIEYYDDTEANDPFAAYSDSDIIATITFESDSGEIGNGFYIRVNRTDNSLYFHSLRSEWSMWGAWKGIEE